MRKAAVLHIPHALLLSVLLFSLPGCSTPTYEVLRTHASAKDINLAAVTELSVRALEQMGYEVTTKHDTGYVVALRPACRFWASHKMAVWVSMDSETGMSLRVECNALRCLDCREREEVERFYNTFYELAEHNGYGGIAPISYPEQIELSASGKSSPLTRDRNRAIRQQRLGVSILKLTPELRTYMALEPDAQGVIITEVLPGSPAGRSGMQRGDLIARFGQTAIGDPRDLDDVQRLPPGPVEVTICREGKILTKRIVLDSKAGTVATKKTSHVPSQPSILKETGPMVRIHAIETEPLSIPAGSMFDLRVEYTVTDSSVKEEEVPIKLSYKIFDGTKVFLSKPVEVKGLNGSRTPATLHLKAAKKKGSYTIQALLNYKNQISERSTELKVE